MSRDRLRGARILLVEDNTDLTPSFRRMLEMMGAEVQVCVSASAVRALLLGEGDHFASMLPGDDPTLSRWLPNVIVTDYSLVGAESGVALSAWLQNQPEALSRIPRVLLTGAMERALQEVSQAELGTLFVAVYQKPIPMEHFLATIKGVCVAL